MKNIIFFSALFLPALLYAQVVTVSDEIPVRDNVSYYMIDDQRGNILFFQNKDTKFEVQGYDGNLHKKWDKELALDKKRPEIIDVTNAGGDFCVFYTFRRKQHLVVKAHRYDAGANLVDSTTLKDLGIVFYKPNFEVTYSEDKKIALLWNIENQDEINVMAFHVGRMKMLWERKFTTNDFLFSRDFQQMLVDNKGDMFFVLKKDNKRSKIDEHHLEVFECNSSEDSQVKRYSVPMQGHLTYDVYFTYDNLNKSLVAGGLYSDDNTSKADGYFYMNISHANPENQVLAFHPFEDEFVKILLEKDKSKKTSLTEVKVQEVVLRRDGGILLIGELAKEFVRGGASASYYGRTGIRPIIDYYYDDIFLFSIHPDGNLHWKNILHKKQYSQDDDASYSSYFLLKTPSALRVIFNDEIKQENTVSEYVVSGNGEYDRNAVMNTERKELAIRFRDGIQVSANSFVAPSERRHKVRLVKVEYK